MPIIFLQLVAENRLLSIYSYPDTQIKGPGGLTMKKILPALLWLGCQTSMVVNKMKQAAPTMDEDDLIR